MPIQLDLPFPAGGCVLASVWLRQIATRRIHNSIIIIIISVPFLRFGVDARKDVAIFVAGRQAANRSAGRYGTFNIIMKSQDVFYAKTINIKLSKTAPIIQRAKERNNSVLATFGNK